MSRVRISGLSARQRNVHTAYWHFFFSKKEAFFSVRDDGKRFPHNHLPFGRNRILLIKKKRWPLVFFEIVGLHLIWVDHTEALNHTALSEPQISTVRKNWIFAERSIKKWWIFSINQKFVNNETPQIDGVGKQRLWSDSCLPPQHSQLKPDPPCWWYSEEEVGLWEVTCALIKDTRESACPSCHEHTHFLDGEKVPSQKSRPRLPSLEA